MSPSSSYPHHHRHCCHRDNAAHPEGCHLFSLLLCEGITDGLYLCSAVMPRRPGCADVDLGPGPILEALKTPGYPLGWGGWAPFTWKEEAEKASFEAYSAGGKPTIFTILQIILSRGGDGGATLEWVDKVKQWDFERVIPAHFNAPLAIGPAEFSETFDFIRRGSNEVRFCDEDVRFLRGAEESFLNFSVFKTKLGTLRGRPCGPA